MQPALLQYQDNIQTLQKPFCPQVYEREAICNHLRRSCSDPVTRQELPGLSLTPIYLLRSRAMDYREQTCATRSMGRLLSHPV